MRTEFPPELVDHIIDYNHDDPETLRACSLTSRSWRSTSQHHLFHSVTIINSATLWRFIRLIEDCPRLARLVRELCFNAYANYRDPDLPLWIHEMVFIPVDKLVRLRSLRFDKVEWNRISISPQFQSDLKRFAGVEDLCFSGCSFATFIDFERIAFSLPSLSNLSVDLVSWTYKTQYSIDMRLEAPTQLPLVSMKMQRYADIPAFTSWLRRMPVLSSLQSVAFDWVLASEAKTVGSFLKSLGPSLRDLRIGCRFDQDPAIASCEQLVTL